MNKDRYHKQLALLGASVFLTCALALGAWIRKL